MEIHVAKLYMVLTAETRIVRNPKAKTEYITIPSVLAQDSTYPFKDVTDVLVEIVPERKELVVKVLPRLSSASKRK